MNDLEKRAAKILGVAEFDISSILQAWMLVEKCHEKGMNVVISHKVSNATWVWASGEKATSQTSAPEAITRACCEALEAENE